MNKNTAENSAVFFYFLRLAGALAGAKDLYSRYNNSQHVYAINADNAVIKPANKPSENTANKMIAANNTMVSPRFFAKTAISFLIAFIFFPFILVTFIISQL